MNNVLGAYEKAVQQKEAEFDVSLFKRQMLGVLKAFDEFCRRNGLRYSLAYGSLIGAIRHKGFIPWDDDIDVVMPRPDYERFISLTSNGMSENYSVVSIYNNKDYYLRFAKVFDARTTLIEQYQFRRCPIGSYIDIFPVDGMVLGYKENDRRDKAVRSHVYVSNNVLPVPFRDKMDTLTFLKNILYRIMGKTVQGELLKADKISQEIAFEGSPIVMYYGSANKYMAAFPTSFFDNLIDIPFENITVRCFAKYDAYLTCLYGNYMQLPPKEAQVSHHDHYFVDLSRRWTIDELKRKGVM